MKNRKARFFTAAAIITAIIAAVLAYTFRSGDCLVLRNGDTNEELARFRVKEGDEFSVTFIHSVNQYPLTDVYQIRDHKIYVVRTIYNNFGAGVQTELEDGQTLTYDENGEMVISDLIRRCRIFRTSWVRSRTIHSRSMEKKSV